jgi:hypothetical protein
MITYSDWIRRVFDHRVVDPAWYWNDESGTSEPQCVEYLTCLFEDPEPVLAPYSDAQLNQGFWYLVDASCSNYIFSLIEAEVSWPKRQKAVRAIVTLFERLFAQRCSDHLSHIDKEGATSLNSVCYAWWDIFPKSGQPENPASAEIDAELLAVMKRILALDSVACQESALHGLGHWQMHYPVFVREAIDDFLDRKNNLRSELRRYAQHARQGYVQ